MDRILIVGMAFFGRHGVHPGERELGGRFTVDVELEADLASACRSDQLEDTVDYMEVHAMVRDVVEGVPCNLLEAVAERITQGLLGLPRVERATVRIHKRPPTAGEIRSFAVELTRSRSR